MEWVHTNTFDTTNCNQLYEIKFISQVMRAIPMQITIWFWMIPTTARLFTILISLIPTLMAGINRAMLAIIVKCEANYFEIIFNCDSFLGPMVANVDQSDIDRDGIGDACDPVRFLISQRNFKNNKAFHCFRIWITMASLTKETTAPREPTLIKRILTVMASVMFA